MRRSATGLAVALLLAGCSDPEPPATEPGDESAASSTARPSASATPRPTRSTSPSPTPRPTPRPTRTPSPTATPPPTPEPFGGRRVLAISVDGLSPRALELLGRDGAPAIWGLLDRGASTLDARTAVERTVTLPNHTGMVTGRPVALVNGGHGIDYNSDRPGGVVPGAREGDVESVFTLVHDAGGSTAVFAGKIKFDLLENSWPDAVDVSLIDASLARLGAAATRDLREQRRTFTFLHVADPDEVGHDHGWLSARYLDAVRSADALVARLVAVVRRTRELRESTVVVLTADHGGEGRTHGDTRNPANFTVPFAVTGPGVPVGDLYDLSPGLVDPGDRQLPYGGPQPVRNCDLANVAGIVLGLGTVPGSSCVAASSMPLPR